MLSKSITNFVVTFQISLKRSFGFQNDYVGLNLDFSTRKTDRGRWIFGEGHKREIEE